MSTVPTQDIEIHRGDDKSWRLTVVDNTGSTVDLSIPGTRVRFQVREYYDDDAVVIEKDSDNGVDEIDLTDGALGQCVIHVDDVDTVGVEYQDDYVYDIQVTLSTKEKTVVKGEFAINPDVVR